MNRDDLTISRLVLEEVDNMNIEGTYKWDMVTASYINSKNSNVVIREMVNRTQNADSRFYRLFKKNTSANFDGWDVMKIHFVNQIGEEKGKKKYEIVKDDMK